MAWRNILLRRNTIAGCVLLASSVLICSFLIALQRIGNDGSGLAEVGISSPILSSPIADALGSFVTGHSNNAILGLHVQTKARESPSAAISTANTPTAAPFSLYYIDGTDKSLSSESEMAYINTRIIMAGVAKDIEPTQIHSIVPKLRGLGREFLAYHIVVYDNSNKQSQSRRAWIEAFGNVSGSNDAFGYAAESNATTAAAKKHNDYTFMNEELRVRGGRTQNLANARNKLLDLITKYNKDSNEQYDYLMITDLDGVCGGEDMTLSYSPAVFRDAIVGRHAGSWEALSFVFVPYWDRWAFRHKDVMKYNMNGRRRAENKIKTPADMQRWLGSLNTTLDELVEVESAFMMLSLYRLDSIMGARYSGVDEDGKSDCEHVAFHKEMASQGARIRLYCQGDEGFLEQFRLADQNHTG